MAFATTAKRRIIRGLVPGLLLGVTLMLTGSDAGLRRPSIPGPVAGSCAPDRTGKPALAGGSSLAGAAQAAALRPGRWTPDEGAAPLQFGVATPSGGNSLAEINNVANLVGERPSIVLFFKSFDEPPPWEQLKTVHAAGATPMITWEPWPSTSAAATSGSPLARITAGDYDAYLHRWGSALAGWGHPVLLRFGHEMNEDWYPWGRGVNGNSPADYVRAWRHVHDVVSRAGAGNVSWVWSPNVPVCGLDALENYYPGHQYVDVVALDGYNWGTSVPWGRWTQPQELFGPGLQSLRTIAPDKPVMIGETATSEWGGSKAEWNRALVSYLAAQPDVVAFIWFNLNKEVDWRLDSSGDSLRSISQALAERPK